MRLLKKKLNAIMDRRTQAIIDGLDCFLLNRIVSRNRGEHLREEIREPRVKIIKRSSRGRTSGSFRGRGFPSNFPLPGSHKPR